MILRYVNAKLCIRISRTRIKVHQWNALPRWSESDDTEICDGPFTQYSRFVTSGTMLLMTLLSKAIKMKYNLVLNSSVVTEVRRPCKMQCKVLSFGQWVAADMSRWRCTCAGQTDPHQLDMAWIASINAELTLDYKNKGCCVTFVYHSRFHSSNPW